MSVFLAVDLDHSTRALTTALIETHRGMVEAKWLRSDKLHCTLVFLGNPSAAQVAGWVPLVDSLAARHRSFTLRLQGSGTFVTRRAPSVLWLGVGGELESLGALQRDAARSLSLSPLTPTLSPAGEKERYVPHVTLARARGVAAFDSLSAQLAGFASGEFGVLHLSLYESSSEVYRVLHQAPLSG